MHYIVFDLEWNQSPSPALSLPELPFEIIEIGAVKLDKNGRIVSRFSELVRPSAYPSVNPIIKKVTKLDNAQLKCAPEFSSACADFLEWCGEDPVFCTWGSGDLTVLRSNMDYYGLEYEFHSPLTYYDVQKLYSLQFGDGKERLSLETAVEQLSLPHADDFHRALQDAYYTACVWQKLDLKRVGAYLSVDYYALPAEGEFWNFDFGTYTKMVTGVYDTKAAAMAEDEICRVRCSRCGDYCDMLVPWFAVSSRYYLTLADCLTHGKMQAKLRWKSLPVGVFAAKTVKPANKERAEKVRKKYKEFLKGVEKSERERKHAAGGEVGTPDKADGNE
ncbi:MAG: exonuclease domain-containing protein [Lachnospiraceae bacterium]|nr:exonuclease domain-containing protein [Lachnospiraceae bacterium]